MSRRPKPEVQRASEAVPVFVPTDPYPDDVRWRTHFPAIVGSALAALGDQRFALKRDQKRSERLDRLPDAAVRIFGAIYREMALALQQTFATGGAPFVVQATAEELVSHAWRLSKKVVKKDELKNLTYYLNLAFASKGVFEYPDGSAYNILDRRYRVRFHYRSRAGVRYFWMDLLARECDPQRPTRSPREWLCFQTPEYASTWTLTQLVTGQDEVPEPAEALTDEELVDLLAAMERARFERLVDLARRLRRAVFAPFALVSRTVPVAAALFLAAALGGAWWLGRTPHPPAPAPVVPFTRKSEPHPPSPALPMTSVPIPTDLAQRIRLWSPPAVTPSSRAVRVPPHPIRLSRDPTTSCADLLALVESGFAAGTCGRIVAENDAGFVALASFAFPILDPTKEYILRLTEDPPHPNYREGGLARLTVIRNVATEPVFFPIPKAAVGKGVQNVEVVLFAVEKDSRLSFVDQQVWHFVY